MVSPRNTRRNTRCSPRRMYRAAPAILAVAAAVTAIATTLSAPALAQGSTAEELAKYRQMLAEGNPAEQIGRAHV